MFKASSLIINELVKHGFVTSFSIRKIKCAILFFFFLLKKMKGIFALQKLLTFFGAKKRLFLHK